MIQLFIFLLIALISLYAISPSSKTQVWLSAVLIPLGVLLVYILILIIDSSYYQAGAATARAFLPAIISGFVIYFSLKQKFENENRMKFPVALVIVIAITLIIGIIQLTLQYSIQHINL
jgi:hypothetical protein